MAGSLDPMRVQVFNLRDLWVEIWAEDIVVNGYFNTDTVWAKGTGWTIANTMASHSGGAGDLTQSGILLLGVKCEVIYTVSGRSAGTITPKAGTAVGTSQNTNDTFTDEIICVGNTDLVFSADAAFDGDIKIVSAKVNLTEYWLYVKKANLDDKITVKSSPQAGRSGRRLTTTSHLYTLALSRLQAKFSEDFGIVGVSADATYEIKLILVNDQNPSLTETHRCRHCQIESRSMKMDELVNNIPTQWAVGEYTPPS
jgi:hypothetical protein